MENQSTALFQFDRLPIGEVHLFGKLVEDYLFQPDKLKSFIHEPPNIEGILKICTSKEKTDRVGLVREIKRQYEGVSIHSKVEKNINALLEENTFCIVTAHQLNLFLGPLYYVHKILSVIKTVDELNSKNTAFSFVPVFVMGSEDHDKEEINHLIVRGENYRWETPQTGSVGRYIVDESLISVRDSLIETLHEESLKAALNEAYKIGEPYSFAHRKLLNFLFEIYGVVIVDMDCNYAKEICHSMFKDEVENRRAQKVLEETISSLELGYEVQAKPRDINIFKLTPGSREYVNDAEDFSKIEKVDLSPNVIFRPLMQQKVLPSVCYIGGGGELGYWLELKSLFEYHQIQFPVLMLRDHAVYIENKIKQKLIPWGIGWRDLWKNKEVLAGEVVKRNYEFEGVFKESKTEIDKIFDNYKEQAHDLDVTLVGAVESERNRVKGMIDHLENKFVKSAKRKNEVLMSAIERGQHAVFPNGMLMERNTGFFEYFDQFGRNYFDELLIHMTPFSKEILFLQY